MSETRTGELKRLTSGPTTAIETTCQRCSKPMRVQAPPAETTFGRLIRETGGVCDDCSPILEAEHQAQVQAELDATEIERKRRMVADSGVPAKFTTATFESCRRDGMPSHAVTAAEQWANGERLGLLLVGPVGVGKTTLAAAACNARMATTNRIVRWMTAPVLFASLGEGFESPSRERVLRVLQGQGSVSIQAALDGQLPMLPPFALDDIDKGRPTAYGAEQIFLAIDQRVANESQLLVTANLGLDALEARWDGAYGPAIVSRLIEHCGGAVLIEGDDRRKRR